MKNRILWPLNGCSRDASVEKLFDNAKQTIFYDFLRTEARGQGHVDPNVICNTLPPKMHLCIKYGIPISNDIGDMLQTTLFSKEGQISQ